MLDDELNVVDPLSHEDVEDCDWSGWRSSGLLNVSNIILSDCRDLVEVPSGIDWSIRTLDEKYPQYCWKYAERSSIIQYHYDIAKKKNTETDFAYLDAVGDFAVLPIFYGTLPHFISPYEISIQPKYLDRVRRNMSNELNIIYKSTPECDLNDDEIFPTVACVCCIGDEWYRARIIKMSGDDIVFVELVDVGAEKLVSRTSLRRLLKRFGRVPPLALKCRIKDVYPNDLDTAKIISFYELIKKCGNLVRVELTNTEEEPFMVNLFHPTVDGLNLGKIFYRKIADAQREMAKDKNWEDHIRRENNDNDSDFEDEEEEELEEELIRYIRRFNRCQKPIRMGFSSLYVSHIENSRLIFLSTQFMIEKRKEIEEQLKAEWDMFPCLPNSWIEEGVACCIQISNQLSYRATINHMNGDDIEVLLIDHGRFVNVSKENIRLLPENDLYMESPLMTFCSLNDANHIHPHQTQIDILKELLPIGTEVKFSGTKNNNRNAGRINIIHNQSDVQQLLDQRLSFLHVDITCRSLLLRSPSRPPPPPSSFLYKLFCPPSLIKGNLVIESID